MLPCRRLLAATALTALACGHPTTTREPNTDPLERFSLSGAQLSGLSGLSTDPQGRLWAVPERGRQLVRIEERRATSIPLEGVPEGTDTESMAFLDGRRVAFGTETQQAGRAADVVLIAELSAERARVVETIPLPYAILGIPAETNRGIEGLCAAGGTLVAAFETVDVSTGARRAVIATRRITGGDWTIHHVRLTSETGKISALACRTRGRALDVLAIERHYEVIRLVDFTLPDPAVGGDVRATLRRDFAGRLQGDPNLEGLVALGGATGMPWRPTRLEMIVDNDSGGLTGPNELIRLRGGL